jgi:hypothetical protein
MLRLNKQTTTISGEAVTPYLVENGNIYCWNRTGETTVKRLDDFAKPDLKPVIEKMTGGAGMISVTPIRGSVATITKIDPVVETEISRPTLEAPAEEQTIRIGNAVVSSPDETEDEKVIYVHVEPAVDNNLADGELQVGGVEVVPIEEAENRIEFIPAIDDDDYI